MKDSFIFEGKKYISARRASEISGYASDYVGQLCRASKLDCRMVGRSWFVTEESLHLHKAAISREEGQRSRIENLRGKSEVKVNPVQVSVVAVPVETVASQVSNPVASASVVTSQTSSVGKSAVEGKIQSPIDSSRALVVVPSLVPVEVKKFIQEELKKSVVSPWTVEEISPKSSIVYSNDDRPLLPTLNKKENKVSEIADKKIELPIKSPIVVAKAEASKVELAKTEHKVESKKLEVVASKSDVEITKEIKKEVKTENTKILSPIKISTLPLNKIKANIERRKKVVGEVSSKVSKNVIAYQKLARDIILKRVLVPMAILAIFFGVGTGTYYFGSKAVVSVTPSLIHTSEVAKANISSVASSVYESFKSGYKSVVAFFTSPARLAINTDKPFGDVTVSEVTPNGIVLTSSTGSNDSDDAMKQKIRGSFSDDVMISPDNSGTAGVITPVFKDTKGKDFIYVMVPVKDKTDNQANQ